MPQTGCFYEMLVLWVGQSPGKITELTTLHAIKFRQILQSLFDFQLLIRGELFRPRAPRCLWRFSHCQCTRPEPLNRFVKRGIASNRLLQHWK